MLTDPVEEFLISKARATRKVRAVLSAASTAYSTTEMRGNTIIHISLKLEIYPGSLPGADFIRVLIS